MSREYRFELKAMIRSGKPNLLKRVGFRRTGNYSGVYTNRTR